MVYGTGGDTVNYVHWLGARVSVAPEGMIHGRDLFSTDTNTSPDWTVSDTRSRILNSPVPGWRIYY